MSDSPRATAGFRVHDALSSPTSRGHLGLIYAVHAVVMRRRLQSWCETLGRHIVRHGWPDPHGGGIAPIDPRLLSDDVTDVCDDFAPLEEDDDHDMVA